VQERTVNLHDKTVVVTGAGSGIGRASAIGFSRDGATVIGIGRTADKLYETARLCAPGTMHCVVGDIAQPRDVERLFSEASHDGRAVDVLVNNAALYPKEAFLEASIEQWIHALQTNVIGMALCCRMALPGMLKRGFGRVINLGSLAWRKPVPKSSAYAASKAAVRAFTIGLAAEIDRARYPDVLINELLPGFVKTAMSEHGVEPAQVYPHVRFVACLPKGGPTGMTFLQSSVYFEERGPRARLQRLAARLLGRPSR
jgi:NAD(P)-dependent dehydrogenase (short-subunit alcohol dehydrogenase family)